MSVCVCVYVGVGGRDYKVTRTCIVICSLKINDKVDKVGSGRAIYGYIELTCK